MYPDYLKIIVGCSVVVVCAYLFTGCRLTKKKDVEMFSDAQKKLITVMNDSSGLATDTHITVSTELEKLISAYQTATGDTVITQSVPSYTAQIDRAVLYLSSRLFMQTDPQTIVHELNTYIFKTWGITFNNNRNNIRYLLPHHVLECKQGSCVGMSLLYLLLAEKLELPFYGVLAPGHFFVRFDNDRTKINVETLRKGESMSTAWYRHKYGIIDTQYYSMRNCTVTEAVGVVGYNLGTICYHEKHYPLAMHFLEQVVNRCPDFLEAQGNLALVLDAMGDSPRALAMLMEIRSKHPSFNNIDENVASLLLKCSKYYDALLAYTALIGKYPENARFHYGRGVALYQLKQYHESVKELTIAVEIDTGFDDTRHLLSIVKK